MPLKGENVGAKFGFCLAAGDVDGDGADDLMVGSPLAPGRDITGRHSLPDAGKVYVYYAPLKQVRVVGLDFSV